MNLNRLNGWQRLGLVLTAIYWVGVVIAGVQWGFEVGSYAPPAHVKLTPVDGDPFAATAPLAERVGKAQKAGEAAAAAVPPETAYQAELRRAGERMNVPLGEAIRQQQPPAAPSIDANGMVLGEPKSADPPAVPGMFDDLIPAKGPQFAWPPFWLVLGMGAGGYAAIAGLVWAGLGFRKRQAPTLSNP